MSRLCQLAPWAALFIVVASPVYAAEAPQGLSGEAELGAVATSGNTNTRSVNTKARLRYVSGRWRHEGHAAVLRASDGGKVTAERYVLSGKSDYDLSPHNYLFATLRYEKDRFSGYDDQVSEAVGYGRRLVDRPTLTLDLELGLGGRHSQQTGGRRRDVGIVRSAGKLGWNISATARFTQGLVVESGSDNSSTESVSALKVKINGNFALKTSLTVTNNSSVPPGIQHTDTITAVTLVYDF